MELCIKNILFGLILGMLAMLLPGFPQNHYNAAEVRMYQFYGVSIHAEIQVAAPSHIASEWSAHQGRSIARQVMRDVRLVATRT